MPIKDNESFRKARAEARLLLMVSRARGIIRHLGKTGARVAAELERVPALAQQVEEMSSLPDRFNKHFIARGWLHFEMLNADVARECTRLAESGQVQRGEEILIEHFTDENVRRHLRFMIAVAACRPRMVLLEAAANDYAASRYHACVPVVLAQIDGLVKDLGEEFFDKKGANRLVAYDSISAHPEALPQLAKTLSRPRGSTVESPISVPYRHGILHGRDLGYANKLVAAKAWAVLFCLRDWAMRAERGQLGPPPAQPEPSLKDLFSQLRRTEGQKKALKAWVARESPEALEALQSGTPERCAHEFLSAWAHSDLALMAELSAPMLAAYGSNVLSYVQATYADWLMDTFELTGLRDEAAAISEVDALLIKDATTTAVTLRLAYQDDDGNALVRGTANGRWGVVGVRRIE